MTREVMPGRRASDTISVNHVDADGMKSPYTLTIGTYPDDRIGEVFIESSRPDSMLGLLCRDAAVLISIALQHGASIQDLQKGMARYGDDARIPAYSPQSVIGTVVDTLAAKQEEYRAKPE